MRFTVENMWGDIAIAFTIAFLATFMTTPYTIRFAKKIGADYSRYADDIVISGTKEVVKCQTIFKRIIRTSHCSSSLL